MKINKTFPVKALCFALLLGISSCKKDKVEQPAEPDGISVLKSMGFDQSDIQDAGEYYVVEDDMLFPKSKLKATARQALITATAPIYAANQKDIKVYIDQSVLDISTIDWKAEIKDALNEYNNLSGFNINFIITDTEAGAGLKITAEAVTTSSGDPNKGLMGRATWPADGVIGKGFLINTNYNYASSTAGQRKYVIVHELGHNLGFRHTNWKGSLEPEKTTLESGQVLGAYRVGKSPVGFNPDRSSVFNGNSGGTSWAGFSTWDIYALKYVYPKI